MDTYHTHRQGGRREKINNRLCTKLPEPWLKHLHEKGKEKNGERRGKRKRETKVRERGEKS